MSPKLASKVFLVVAKSEIGKVGGEKNVRFGNAVYTQAYGQRV